MNLRIEERLQKMCRSGRVPHALLFTGPDEDALQEAAFHLGKGLLCSSAEAPCGTCESCRKVGRRSHPDLFCLETEKKEINIESVRSLQRWLAIAPHESRRKVGVIFGADALNVSASNALLKTLEEPPPHGVLILLARGVENLLPTIRSRVQTLRFPSPLRDLRSQDEEGPAWIADLADLWDKPERQNSADILALTEQIAKDKDHLPYLFEWVEGRIRDELQVIPPGPTARRLERVFDLTLKTEHEVLHRYPNVGLALDHLLLRVFQGPGTA